MKNKKIIIFMLTTVAIIERVWLDLGPNVELLTTLLVVSSLYLSQKQSLTLMLLALIITDSLLGNTNIFIFTWSGFLLPVLFLGQLKVKQKGLAKVALGTLSGIGANMFFYLWTNFGVWYLDSWGMYPDNASGLVQSLIAGLPFLKYQLSSTIYFVPLTLFFFEFYGNPLKFSALSLFIPSKLKKFNQKSHYSSPQQ